MAKSSKDNSPQKAIGGSSSSSSSSTPPPPPPPTVQFGLGGSSSAGAGGSGEDDSKKKRGIRTRNDVQQGGSSSGERQKIRKKGEMDAPKSEPACSLCGKKFASWKGVFGHLRAHPERDWRGAFPPPKGEAGSWSPIRIGTGTGGHDLQKQQQLLVPTLLDLARESLAKMRQESMSSGHGNAGSSRAADIDLNREPQEFGPSTPPPPQGGSGSSAGAGFDLNLPPPPDNHGEDDHNNE